MGYQLIWKEKLLIIELSGVLDPATIRSYQSCYSDRRMGQIKYVLWDGRGVSERKLSRIDAMKCAAGVIGESKSTHPIKIAFLMNPGADTTLVDLFIETANKLANWESRRFEDIQEADAWLGHSILPKAEKVSVEE